MNMNTKTISPMAVLLLAVAMLLTVSSCGSMKKNTTANEITGKYWKLIELNGKKIEWTEDTKREPHIILKADNKVNGHGGCNGFHGSFEMQAGNRIKFSQVASTLMACLNMEIEDQFFKSLSEVDNYTISEDGKYLSLNKAKMSPLARFEVVYLR